MSDKGYSDDDLREYNRRQDADKNDKGNRAREYIFFAWLSSSAAIPGSGVDKTAWDNGFRSEAKKVRERDR